MEPLSKERLCISLWLCDSVVILNAHEEFTRMETKENQKSQEPVLQFVKCSVFPARI